MAIMLPVVCATSHSIVIATEHSRYRLQGLEGGAVALYTAEGASIILKHNKVIAVECDDYQVKCKRYRVEAEESATFDTLELTATQQVIAEGKISGNGGMAIKGGDGATASFEGNVEHKGGTISSPGVEINGVKHGTHKHTTPPSLPTRPHIFYSTPYGRTH
ncbi:phage baseplate assembly protein V [Serratia symbiotica]|nr:phage baseplate assembly protein V [Serratia symbiotica]